MNNSRMVTVELTTENVEGFDNLPDHFDPATLLEDDISGTQFTFTDHDGNEVEIDVGAIGEIDPNLIDRGLLFSRMPDDVRERFIRLQRDDADYLNQVILVAAIRHTIYKGLEERHRQVDVIVGDDVK